MQSIRLNKLASLIPQCDTLADVGCDHGYIGIEALRRGVAKQVVFVDISPASLLKARCNCPDEFGETVSFICKDGLTDTVVDTAVIAGMGGLEIISILQQTQTLPRYLVLQPMRNQRDVRKYLTRCYEILTDIKISDGKFYDMIVARLSDTPTLLTDLEIEFGKTNFFDPGDDFVAFLQLEYNKLTQILSGCSDNDVANRLKLVMQAMDAIRK